MNENKKYNILVVDDNQINLLYINQILDENKIYETTTAYSGQEAIDLCENHCFDLILLDIMMPVMTGLEACEKIKTLKNYSDIPIIFVTAIEDINSIEKGFEVGGVDYITKPFHQTELLARIKTHIKLKELHIKTKQQNDQLKKEISEKEQANEKLQKAEEKQRNVLDSMTDGVYLCNNYHQIIYTNKAMNKMFPGIDHSKKCFYQIFGDTQSCKWCILSRIEQKNQIIEVKNPKNQRHYQISISPYEIDKNNKGALHIIRDLTEHIETTKKLQLSEDKFESIFENSNDSIILTDTEGKITQFNSKLPDMLPNFNKSGSYLKDLIANEKNLQFNQIWIKLTTHSECIAETTFQDRNKRIPIELNARKFMLGDQERFIIVCRDISERKQLQRELINNTIKTEEKERGRFAKDLHDGIGPLLSTSLLYLNTLSSETNENALDTVTRVHETVTEALKTIKEISNNISPRNLINQGLIKAIHAFAKKLMTAKKMNIEITDEIKSKIPENIEITLYRIAIELLNNTAKYANADIARIKITEKQNTLAFDYTDNGVGFDFNELKQKTQSMGIENMHNRVLSLNGNIKYITAPNKGVKVKIEIKL